MKGFNILLVFLLGLFSCLGQEQSKVVPVRENVSRTFYGTEFKLDKVRQKNEVWQKYTTLAVSDTINLKFVTTVKEVCKVKGCWMIVELGEGEQAMVRFKDYGFFMPMDIPEKEVVLNGMAYVEEMSVADQKHFAADAGSTSVEIAKITAPKRTYSFEASGVLITN